jgi:hypothetical protein
MRSRQVLHTVTVVTVVAGLVVLITDWQADARRDASKYALRVTPPQPSLVPANPSQPSADFGSGPIVHTAPPMTAPISSALPLVDAVPASTMSTEPPPTTVPSTSATNTQLATITTPIAYVYDQPGASRPTEALYSTTEFGNPRVLPITQLGGDWLRVLLPSRPNGSQGWVRMRDVTITTVGDAVDVDLSARHLVWSHAGSVRLDVTTSIGAPRSPTPTGTFFVTDILPSDPAGAYGAWVVALDGHSDAFTSFEGGDPRIAIHGTDAPSTIGAAASNGCLRVDASSLAMLAAALPLGTPVTIH